MTVQASSILDRVRTQLIDINAVKRWSDDELLQWLHDGERTICEITPAATTTRTVLSLDAGTRQELPADANMLLNVIRNVASDGTSPGRAIRVVAREMLDTFDYNWHATTPSSVVQNATYDVDERSYFYVYPPNNGSGKVEVTYSKSPQPFASTAENIHVRDNYAVALFDYVMFRALQKDSDFAAGTQQATMYLNMFNAVMGIGQAGTATEDPNRNLAPTGAGE